MTRAAAALAGGHTGRAWAFNPAVFVLASASAALIVRAAYGRWAGRWLAVVVGYRRAVGVALVALTLALWANQQLHASVLIGGQ